MTEFIFLYRGGEPPADPVLRQEVMQHWAAWMKSLADSGHLVERGHPLERSGRTVRGKIVMDGPFAETKEVVCGFTVIRAADLAEAAELAKGCPIAQAGGAVEVRPVMRLE
jgi:hypothetical protein